MRRTYFACILFFCLLALTSCSRSPKVSFYTLGSDREGAAVGSSKSSLAVHVANISIPELVNRPELLRYLTDNRLEILETHRWAEPLKYAISRLLAESLSRHVGSGMVTAYPQSVGTNPDYTVTVDIRRFDSSGDVVTVDAFWNILYMPTGSNGLDKQDGSDQTLSRRGRSRIVESKVKDDPEVMVAAYSRAIVAVAGDIARAIGVENAAH